MIEIRPTYYRHIREKDKLNEILKFEPNWTFFFFFLLRNRCSKIHVFFLLS